MENQQIDEGAVNLAKAIRQNESGGQMIEGKSGEYGAYQFTPDTWNATAPKYGFKIPLEQSTLEQQNAVAYHRIKEWKDSGKDVTQIASMWNAGEGEPNAYKGVWGTTTKTHKAGDPSVGTNSFGVKYDVPTYAKNIATSYAELKNGGQGLNTDNPSYAGDKNTGVLGNIADNSITRGAGGLVNKLIKPWVDIAAIPMQAGVAGYNALTGSNVKDPYANLQSLGQELPVSSLSDIKGKAKSGLGIAEQAGTVALAATGAGLLSKIFTGGVAKQAKKLALKEAIENYFPKRVWSSDINEFVNQAGKLDKVETFNAFMKAAKTAEPFQRKALIEAAEKLMGPGLVRKILGVGVGLLGKGIKFGARTTADIAGLSAVNKFLK